MSKETELWLNTMTLIGQTDRRGNAWHYREELQGEKSNHYPGPIPVADVISRLFNFTVSEYPLYIAVPTGLEEADGTPLVTYQALPDDKAMITNDTHESLGIHKSGYQGHSYRQWLLENVATILGDGLSISSAGLLRNRGVAWVEVSVSDNIKTPEGIEFRPNLVSATSFDSSLSTTYKRNITAVVCDNTLHIGLSGTDQRLKIKHSKQSLGRIDKVREALALVVETADAFQAELTKLCNTKVTLKKWAQFLDSYVPIVNFDNTPKEGRGLTMAESKREALRSLYSHDDRVSPWAGTAFGVLQACNTWNAHSSIVKAKDKSLDTGVVRGMRNIENNLLGITEKADQEVLNTLTLVLSN